MRPRLHEAEQEIQEKENECTGVIFDKNKLADAGRKAWELEKYELLSAARDEMEDITKVRQNA